MYTLIITEKPSASKAVALALASSKPKALEHGSFAFTHDKKQYITAPAVGHLFTLKQSDKGWNYPSFDLEWQPAFKVNRFSKFSEPYFKNIETLAKGAKNFIIATDYDDEGEVIGFNILRFLCKKTEAKRMRFSTMTKEELKQSFKELKDLNKLLIDGGLTRHYLDWYWGINLTRALTLSIKNSGKRFRILSTGRVQGPTIHMLAKHEKQIRSFKPKTFWYIEADLNIGKGIVVKHSKDKIWNSDDANKIYNSCNKMPAIVKNITKKVMMQKPPKPYNTTSMLADIFRYFGYLPQQGLSVAESLYQSGLISYPRTSSEKLPPDINYKNIISMLSKQKSYSSAAKMLDKELKPEEGSKTDSAHIAIYPTGEYKKMGSKQAKVYDLIVRRFLACFGDPAKRESQRVNLMIDGESFYLNGIKTIEPGWTKIYGKYASREDIVLPDIKPDQKIPVQKLNLLSKNTSPPARFSQGSVLKEMETRGLATKATRAQILQILYNRGYLTGRSINVTDLGIKISDILEKHVPDVVSEKLTRHFENLIEEIEVGNGNMDSVLEEAKKEIIKISKNFKKKEISLGEELTKAIIETQDKESLLGKCPNCSGTLKVHKNWLTKKRFVGCSGYKVCKTGFPLPREGTIISTEKVCEECKTPMIEVRPIGKRPFRMCLDPNCSTKSEWLDKAKLLKAQNESKAASALALTKTKVKKSKKVSSTKDTGSLP